MGQGAIDYIGVKRGGLDINGLIENYYVYAGENVSAGGFVEFVNGIASKKTETSVDTPISTNSYNGKTISAVVLDDNRVFIAHSHSTNYYLLGIVCTINGATIIPGVDTMLSQSNYRGVTISAVKLEDNKVFVAHSAGTAIHLYGVICTIDNITITAGTDTTIVGNDNAGHAISTIPLTNDRVFISHCNGTAFHLYGIVCTITGTTITIGTDVSLDGVEYSGLCVSVTELENNKAFVAHNDGGAYYLSAMICTISGTTISKGTDTALVSGYEHCGDYISAVTLKNTKVFIAHSRGSSYYLNALVCTINNTTITPGTDYALDSTNFESEGISTVVLPSGQVFISHRDNSQYLGGIVCTINNTTITNGGDKTLSSNKFQGTTTSSVLINDNIFIAHNYDKDERYLYAQIFGIDETNNVPTNNVTTIKYETQVRPATSLPCNGVAKTSGTGGDSTGHKDIVSVYIPEVTEAPTAPTYTYVNFTSSPIPTTWVATNDGENAYAENDYGRWIASVTGLTSGYPVQNAFDDSTTSYYYSHTVSSSVAVYVWLYNPENIYIKPTSITITYDDCSASSQVHGIKEDGSIVALFSLTGSSSKKTLTKTVETDEYFVGFRIGTRIYSGSTGNIKIYNFKVTEGTIRYPNS